MSLKFTKLYLLILGCVLLFVPTLTHAQSYYFMQKGGSPTVDEGLGISVDDSSNSYSTGYFTGTASFSPFSVTCTGISDIFVAKTDANGHYKWVVKAGDGSGSDRGLAIKTDAKGNSYVTGFYYGTAHFGILSVTAAGLQDMFVAKYDRNGRCKWVVSGGGTQADIGNAINIDAAGNVVVTGEFAGTATFGSFNLTSTANNVNVFTAKLDSANGNFLWAKSGVGPHTDRGLGIACDQNNNVYVTGQFTDTITFGSAHFTNLYNAIFLVKYDASGNEQWFTHAGGGTFNIANGIDADRNNNIYLTGDFTGTLTFFGSSNYNLTQTYTNRIFIAKYDASSNLLWAVADGSNASVSSKSISVDSLGNPYIIGNFDCKMNSYADQYGQGTFNTVGYWDIFGAEYSATGTWQWSRQIGGHNNNYGNSIAVTKKGDVFTTGSFDQDVFLPVNPINFLGYNVSNSTLCNSTYCTDPYYGDFKFFNTAGNLDVFIARPFDLSRQPYDYYLRSGNTCSRPYEGVCIDSTCPDTVMFCSSGTLKAKSFACNQAGPVFKYLWSTSQVSNAITVSTTGWYSVTQTSADGCFVSKDSVYVIIHQPPAPPNLSDNVIINTNSTNPQPIHICADSVKLWGGGFGNDSYFWSDTSSALTLSIEAKKNGVYCFNIKDSNGCSSQVCVTVTLDSAFRPIKPKLKCLTCDGPYYDTVRLCKGNSFPMFPYDSISNPAANTNFCIPPSNAITNYWYANPNTINYNHISRCPGYNFFTPQDSGWYYITDTLMLRNLCDSDTVVMHDSVYVHIFPKPVIGPMSITGGGSICPGDSVLLVAHDTSMFSWSTGSTKDSIWANTPGVYRITTTITNSYGCGTTGMASITVGGKTTPPVSITFNGSATICPNDSVQLSCSGGYAGSSYQWYGPSGPIGNNSSTIWVKTPGAYYVVNTDTSYCNSSLSNTLTLYSYATPYLSLPVNSLLCAGDSLKVQVNSSPGAVIQWQAPLSGSDSVMYLKNAGTFTCKIVSCGITTVANITISKDNPLAQITAKPAKQFCIGDSIVLTGNGGMTNYSWSPSGATTQSIVVKTTGVYTLTITDSNGCRAIDTVHTQENNYNVSAPFASDTLACPGTPVTLFAAGSGTILWYDSLGGSVVGTGPTFIVPAVTGYMVFYVIANEGGCLSSIEQVTVNTEDCGTIYIPNIFTPNGDGKNDVWHVTFPGAKCFHAEIFNRWGVKVFESNSVQAGWDGKIMQTGMDASDGVYYFILNYCDYLGKTGTDHGFIQLIR